MLALAALLVGFILGWIVTWVLQNRIDDNLNDEVAKLQRQLVDCQRELDKAQAAAPPQIEATPEVDEEDAVEDPDALATRSAGVEALAVEETTDEATVVESADAEAAEVEAVAYEVAEVTEEDEEEAAEEPTAEIAAETVVETVVETVEDEDEDALETRAAAVAVAAATPTVTDRDEGVVDLTVIKGIGPKFAETLNTAGIISYAGLAETSPDQLQEIVQPAAWQRVDFEDWITQASALSRQSRRLQIGDDLTRLEGIGPTYAQTLRAAGITSFAQLAENDEESLASVIDAPTWRKVAYGDWIAQAILAASGDEAGLKELQDQLNSRQGDNIGLIQGIGSATLTALTDAGITTYAQLAEATPEQLAGIMSEAGVRRGNFDAWIEEAKQRSAGKRVSHGGGSRTRTIPEGANASACPQDLGQIEGIGETYEQRLYNSGIGAFWEVGQLPQEELTDILEIKAFQNVDVDAIQESARSLAESTGSMGRVWDGTEPDDFEVLDGIGEVFERRLYDAGICTFAALAQLTEERLQEICQAPPNFAPNFTRWLQQAQEAGG